MANTGSRSSAASGSRRHNDRGASSSSNHARKTIRCTHYKRECNMVAPCCGKIVCCEIGHDSSGQCRNKLDGHVDQVHYLVCCDCNQTQGIRNSCQNRRCKISFGKYGCLKCKKWDNKDSFHCDSCGVCRRGRREHTRHCAVCNKCYPLNFHGSSHVCTTKSKCVGCGIDTHRSREESTTMACGHSMHKSCFLRRVQKSYTCPVKSCGKTVRNMERWNKELEKRSEGQRKKNPTSIAKIHCNDCRSICKVHTGGNLSKCRKCGSFNTTRIQ